MKTEFIIKYIMIALFIGTILFLINDVINFSYSAAITGFLAAMTLDCVRTFRKSKNAKN